MRPYMIAAMAAGIAISSPSMTQEHELDKAPCNGTFSLRPDSKIVDLLTNHNAAEESVRIQKGKIYALENFVDLMGHFPWGIEQKIGLKNVRIRPLSVLYFDADPKGFSKEDALYITVQVYEGREFSWTYRQCEKAASMHPKVESLQKAIEETVIIGLEYKLNDLKGPMTPSDGSMIANAIRK